MSGIIYTPKEPREQIKRKLSRDARKRMSQGGKNASRVNTAASLSARQHSKFINDNPLEAGEFYVRIIDDKDHKRRFVTNELHVSLDGANWFEVSDVIKMVETQGDERQ